MAGFPQFSSQRIPPTEHPEIGFFNTAPPADSNHLPLMLACANLQGCERGSHFETKLRSHFH